MYQPIQLTSTIPSIRNSRSRSPLWRRVLFVTVAAAALVALAVALQPVAHADTTSTPTPTPTPAKFILLRMVPLPSNSWGAVTVNEGLNKIYTSGNPSSNTDTHVTVINGRTFATPGKDVGLGNHLSVDNKTNRYWVATIYGGSAVARTGTTDSVVATVNVGYCPVGTTYDFFNSRIWVGAQCGGGNDPVFAIDANTFQVIAGPIGSHHVMSNVIANGANGRLYLSVCDCPPGDYFSERVDPNTFALTYNAFGLVMAINAHTNRLYALSGNTLQIINGTQDPEVILANIPLGYTPGSMGINTAFNYLYITNPAGRSIQVRNGSTGHLITTFSLATGVMPSGAMAVDSIRGRIYVIQNPSGNSGPALLVIEDLINATKPNCVLSH